MGITLLSRQLGKINFSALCLGCWGILCCGVNAQDTSSRDLLVGVYDSDQSLTVAKEATVKVEPDNYWSSLDNAAISTSESDIEIATLEATCECQPYYSQQTTQGLTETFGSIRFSNREVKGLTHTPSSIHLKQDPKGRAVPGLTNVQQIDDDTPINNTADLPGNIYFSQSLNDEVNRKLTSDRRLDAAAPVNDITNNFANFRLAQITSETDELDSEHIQQVDIDDGSANGIHDTAIDDELYIHFAQGLNDGVNPELQSDRQLNAADALVNDIANNFENIPLAQITNDEDELESDLDQQEDIDDTLVDETDNPAIDDELGILRLRSQPVGADSELGLLRVRPTEDIPLEAEPEPTPQTSVFLTGRANVYGGNNLFRTPDPIDDRIYQTGIGILAFPRLSDRTNLIIGAEANLARYEDLSIVDYNEIQLQAGIRQRLTPKSYGQINWRYQDLNTPGSTSFFTADYIELLLSRRDILNNRTWLEAYYQARFSDSDPKEFSRFTQIRTASLNYGFSAQTRVSLLYQLFIDDYTQVRRHDTYHQVLAQFDHDISSTTRLSLFTGFRFGRSSLSTVNFDDTIYGASINVNIPLF